MPKFMYLYKGPATPAEELSEEDSSAIMAKWGEWMDKVGEANMVDMGSPLEPRTAACMVDDGKEDSSKLDINGYTIIEAEDMAAAKKMAEGHPFLSDETGEFSIEIFELLPVPGM